MSDDQRLRTLTLPSGDRVVDPAEPAIERIGRFEITGRLGEGGMGVVFAGRDPDLGRAVAIKLLSGERDHPDYRARLLREARAMALIDHVNVVRIYEIGTDRGRVFVAMELVDGSTLATWLDAEPRSWRDVVAMFVQAGDGLAAVHRAGLVHRDFKPENVLVDRGGRARLADFGIARLDPGRAADEPALAAAITRTGIRMGTPRYMAPEQILGGEVDARADQYAFCVALREALREQPTTKDIAAAIARGRAPVPADRFATMEDLLAALGAKPSRTRLAIVLVGIAAVATIAIVVGLARADHASAIATSVTIDAAVATVTNDAAVVTSVTNDAAVATPGDASSLDAPAPRSGDKARAASQPAVDPTRHDVIAAHLPAVRVAIASLGYAGLKITGDDRAEDIRVLRNQLAVATDDLERGKLGYAIGAGERMRGDCATAKAAWRPARVALAEAYGNAGSGPIGDAHEEFARRQNQRMLLMGRMLIGEALCQLAAGHASAALTTFEGVLVMLLGASDHEFAAVRFALGIAHYESGARARGKELIMIAARGDDALHAAIDTYARAVGIDP